LRDADSPWLHIEATGKSLLHDPAVGGIAVDFRDISERTHDQQEIRELYEELERRIEDRTARLVEATKNWSPSPTPSPTT
jgi:hypothetical protein